MKLPNPNPDTVGQYAYGALAGASLYLMIAYTLGAHIYRWEAIFQTAVATIVSLLALAMVTERKRDHARPRDYVP